MVAAFDYCLHGKGGAAPSIDTAMHGLVDAAHVDHLHPDSGIAIATAADGEALTKEIFGDQVVWVPWRRPGFQLGLDIAAIKAENPQADRLRPRRSRHHRLGRHVGGVGAELALDHPTRPRPTSPSTPRPSRSAPALDGYGALPEAERRAKAAALAPTLRSIASYDKPMVGHFTDDDRVLDFLAAAEHPRLAALGTSCPDHFLRTKVKPLVLDLPAGATRRGLDRPAEGAARAVPGRLPGLLRPQRHPGVAGHPRRRPVDHPGARRRHVQLRQGQADRPGGGGVLPQRDQRDARRRGRVHLRADRRGREVPDRVLGAGGGQAAADAQAEAARHPDRAGHRRRLRHRQGHRRPGSPPRAPAS